MIWWRRFGVLCFVLIYKSFHAEPFSSQIMNPIKHLCEELIEQKRMRETYKRYADDLTAGGCVPASKRQK
jgi:hypothetical protein